MKIISWKKDTGRIRDTELTPATLQQASLPSLQKEYNFYKVMKNSVTCI